MKRPDMSWRPTTGQLTATALAIVCLLVGFWIGWQHRSSTDPQTVTPSVPANMRTRNVIVLPTTAAPATVTTAPTTTGTTPAIPLPPRSQVKVAVLNAGTTSGVAVQIAVSIVQQGYPTPLTGNVTLPPSLVPTQTLPSTVPPTTASTTTGPAGRTATTVPSPTTTSTATTPPAVPQIIYYRSGDQGIAARLGADLGISDIAPAPASAALQAAAATAQLIVVVGNP
jgi:hypothetical protein